jgi:hypothetical protein
MLKIINRKYTKNQYSILCQVTKKDVFEPWKRLWKT